MWQLTGIVWTWHGSCSGIKCAKLDNSFRVAKCPLTVYVYTWQSAGVKATTDTDNPAQAPDAQPVQAAKTHLDGIRREAGLALALFCAVFVAPLLLAAVAVHFLTH